MVSGTPCSAPRLSPRAKAASRVCSFFERLLEPAHHDGIEGAVMAFDALDVVAREFH